MGFATFVPEIWSSVLLASLKKSEVYASITNRNYEGEIANQGDTVHINSISRPTINAYTVGATITVESLTTADRTLLVDQADYFAFEVDDIDKRQVAGSVMEMAMVEAAYALADKVDQFIAGKYADVATANKVNAGAAVSVLTGATAYTQLTKLKQKLDEANVPMEGRFAIIPPWYLALLLDSTNFAANPAANISSALITGQIGRAVGLDILVSNNVVTSPFSGAATTYAVLAGVPGAISFVEQINQVEAYRLQTTFADAVRGLHLYGAKTIRPDAIAYLGASTV
jgi:hypothetical protein